MLTGIQAVLGRNTGYHSENISAVWRYYCQEHDIEFPRFLAQKGSVNGFHPTLSLSDNLIASLVSEIVTSFKRQPYFDVLRQRTTVVGKLWQSCDFSFNCYREKGCPNCANFGGSQRKGSYRSKSSFTVVGNNEKLLDWSLGFLALNYIKNRSGKFWLFSNPKLREPIHYTSINGWSHEKDG